MTAYCRDCGSEIVVKELRGGELMGGYDTFRSYPIGTISFCPVHGTGFRL